MKIVLLARYLPAEGSTVQMYSLAAGLIEQHHEVHVLSAGPGEDPAAKRLFAQSEAKGVQHHKVGFPLRPSFSPIGKLIQLFTYFTALPRALWLLFRIRPGIVHVHYPVTSFIAKIFGLITHTPFVVTHHTMGIPRHPLNWRGDAAIAISSDLERDLVERVGYSPVAVHRVFNGVDTDRFQPPSAQDRAAARAMLGLPSDEMLILFVGSIEHHKGLDVLLDALSRCEVPRPRAVIMGDGDDAWLRRETLTHGVEDSVIRLPFSDPLSAYQAADMFVLPSRREGFPLVSVEAMACGLPVIRSNTEGATDQIDHGETGLLFPSEDAKALHECIQQLASDSALREALGAAAARKARSVFSQDAMTEATLAEYERCLNSEGLADLSSENSKTKGRASEHVDLPKTILTIGLLTSVGATLDAFFVEIVRHWETQGVRVVTAAGDASRFFPDQSVIQGVTRNPQKANVKAIAGLRNWVTQEQIDVVITNTATASTLVRSANVNARVVYFCHGLHWNGSRMRDLPFRLLERALLGRTDGIICINSADENWFIENAPEVPRLRLNHGVGLDTIRFSRQPPTTWNGTDTVRLVWCGELIPRKNPKAAIDLARSLHGKGLAVHLDMLGEGPLARTFELPTEPGLEVVLVGRTDPVPYFRDAHALMQTSRWEGLPRVALEAVAMGRPTVGFDVKGVQDIPGAYLAPEDDIGLLAAQTVEAVTSGPRALPPAQDLSYERAADAILGFVRSVVEGRFPYGRSYAE